IRSTLRRTKSAASSGRRSWPLFSAKRYSVVKFFPSIQPSLLSSCRNSFTMTALPEAVPASRKPILKTLPVCCASAEERANSRMAAIRQIAIFVFIVSASPLSNHLVCSRQHVGRNRQADLLRCFQVDDELELRRLLYRKVGGLSAFQNLVHISSGA